jgi:hypothetical protein
MKGLDLAEAYYHKHGSPMIESKFGSYVERIAAGFVGPGSECLGFDDEISRDHDWGPGFCLWLTEEDHTKIGKALQEEYEKLPERFMGFGPRIASPGEEKRTGVCEIRTFYKTYTGLDHVPASLKEWIYIPEQALGTCTNGRIFSDSLGEFSRWRETLLQYYPEDVRLKKIASRCMTIAQAGQYNFERSLRRKDLFAVNHAQMSFCADVISLVFLLNRRYIPFYKWMYRGMKELPILGKQINDMISDLMARTYDDEKIAIIEEICALIVETLRHEGLTDSASDFLLDHAHRIHEKIESRDLRERFTVTN